MTYDELIEIYNKKINITTNALPTDAFFLASYLGLRVENSIQCKKYYANNGEVSPLTSCNACLCLLDGEYIIYHDEKYPYKNFAIAHELSHYLLGDATDGVTQHHNANLLAAIIVAPPHLLDKSKITSVTELSLQCKIPIESATEYWSEYCDHHSRKRFKKINRNKIIFAVTLCFTLISIGLNLMFLKNTIGNLNNNTYVINTDTQAAAATITSETTLFDNVIKNIDINNINLTQKTYPEIVYVTKSGEKFHTSTCQYIVHANTTLQLSYDEAIDLGYEPCKVCFN